MADLADAMEHIRVDTIYYEVTDVASAIRAGRRWAWVSRVAQHMACELDGLHTDVLDGLVVAAESLRTGEFQVACWFRGCDVTR